VSCRRPDFFSNPTIYIIIGLNFKSCYIRHFPSELIDITTVPRVQSFYIVNLPAMSRTEQGLCVHSPNYEEYNRIPPYTLGYTILPFQPTRLDCITSIGKLFQEIRNIEFIILSERAVRARIISVRSMIKILRSCVSNEMKTMTVNKCKPFVHGFEVCGGLVRAGGNVHPQPISRRSEEQCGRLKGNQ
jgi:hypothetical protein